VMVLMDESPAVERVAVAEPVASVVAWVTAMPPELAANVTTTPEIRLLAELRAKTVMVAGAEPSEGIDVTLDVAVSDAGTTVGVVVVVVVVVPVDPVVPAVVEPEVLSEVELPPHAASSIALKPSTIANLRMSDRSLGSLLIDARH
jgi:hypothetical protein